MLVGHQPMRCMACGGKVGCWCPEHLSPKKLRLLSWTHLKCCQNSAYYLALQHDPGFSLRCNSIAAGMSKGVDGELIST